MDHIQEYWRNTYTAYLDDCCNQMSKEEIEYYRENSEELENNFDWTMTLKL